MVRKMDRLTRRDEKSKIWEWYTKMMKNGKEKKEEGED